MQGVCVIIAALASMAAAYLCLLRTGFVAGAATDDPRPGYVALGTCITPMLAQAALWMLLGFLLGGMRA